MARSSLLCFLTALAFFAAHACVVLVMATTTTTTTTATETTHINAPTMSFAPLPPDATTFTTQPPPATTSAATAILDGIDSVSTIAQLGSLLQTAAAHFGVTRALFSFALAYPGLGTFVKTGVCRGGSNVSIMLSGSTSEFAMMNIAAGNFTAALTTCLAFSPSPATLQDSALLMSENLLAIGVFVDNHTAGTALSLNSGLPVNTGPTTGNYLRYFYNQTCSVEVHRGARFSMDFGPTLFVHPLGLVSRIVYAEAGSLMPLPSNVRVSCTNISWCSVRGTISDSVPLLIAFTASDFLFRRTIVCEIVPVHDPLHVDPSQRELDYTATAGQPIVFAVPLSMFISSTAFSITAVRTTPSGPLPTGLAFHPPNTLIGAFAAPGVYNLTVVAADHFVDATGYIIVHVQSDTTTTSSAPSTPVVPVLTSGNSSNQDSNNGAAAGNSSSAANGEDNINSFKTVGIPVLIGLGAAVVVIAVVLSISWWCARHGGKQRASLEEDMAMRMINDAVQASSSVATTGLAFPHGRPDDAQSTSLNHHDSNDDDNNNDRRAATVNTVNRNNKETTVRVNMPLSNLEQEHARHAAAAAAKTSVMKLDDL